MKSGDVGSDAINMQYLLEEGIQRDIPNDMNERNSNMDESVDTIRN
jgi:hypothetical protein